MDEETAFWEVKCLVDGDYVVIREGLSYEEAERAAIELHEDGKSVFVQKYWVED